MPHTSMGSHNDAVFNFEFDRSFSALSNNSKDVEMTCVAF